VPEVRAGVPESLTANGIVIMLHELAHAALHSRWLGALALMEQCAERIDRSRPMAAARIRNVVSSARADGCEALRRRTRSRSLRAPIPPLAGGDRAHAYRLD
jgi:hypothetical protein